MELFETQCIYCTCSKHPRYGEILWCETRIRCQILAKRFRIAIKIGSFLTELFNGVDRRTYYGPVFGATPQTTLYAYTHKYTLQITQYSLTIYIHSRTCL